MMSDDYPTFYLKETRDLLVYHSLLKLYKLNDPRRRADCNTGSKHSVLARKLLITKRIKYLLENPDPRYQMPYQMSLPSRITQREEKLVWERIQRMTESKSSGETWQRKRKFRDGDVEEPVFKRKVKDGAAGEAINKPTDIHLKPESQNVQENNE